MNVNEIEIRKILNTYRKICFYGMSPDPSKPSHSVPLYMKDQGYDVVGVYPKPYFLPGVSIFKSLSEVPEDYRKFLDVFRSSERIPEVVAEVVEVGGVEVLWLQLGIENSEAEQRAEDLGIKVISNRCIKIEHSHV